MVIIHNVLQGSPAWHALRAGKYTGSNAWKLLRYGAIDYALAQEGSAPSNYWSERGHLLEPECIELYQAINKTKVARPGFVTNTLYPMAGYSPDGIAGNILIECKAFKAEKHLSVHRGDIPFEVQAQIQFGFLICELKEAHLVIYNPELEPKLAFKIIVIRRNPAVQNNFKRILGKELAYAP